MKRAILLGIGSILCLGGSASARPDAVVEVKSPATGILGTTQGTTFFGGTFWAADSARWEALPGGTWTFDSGVGSGYGPHAYSNPFKDPSLHTTMEGWIGVDQTFSLLTYFRRLNAAAFGGGPACVGAAAGLGGNYSFWAGVLPSEADALCYAAGQGYGNHWSVCIRRNFLYDGVGSVNLQYDYAMDLEPGFDYSYVFSTVDGEDVEVSRATGVANGTANHTLFPGVTLPNIPGPVFLKFCVNTDPGYSDEDGFYPTSCGALAIDNVQVNGGGIAHFADFEASSGGWVLAPPTSGRGEWSDLRPLWSLPPPLVGGPCGIQDTVLVFQDDLGGHPSYADNMAVSPWIDLLENGLVGPGDKIIQYDAYLELPYTNYVFVQARAQWYPNVCAVTGTVGPSDFEGFNYYFGEAPRCSAPGTPFQANLTGVIDPTAEQVRIALGVVSFGRFYPDWTGITNSTPWFDNVRFCVVTTPVVAAVILPNGGESFVEGSIVDIQWSASSSYPTNDVDLMLSRTGPGGPFEDIALAIPNSGSYLWNVTGPHTTNAYIQVTARDTGGNSGVDVSDSAFEILTAPTATLLSPNGGECWFIGNTMPIAWNTQDGGTPIQGVTIELSRTGPFGPYQTLVSNHPDTGNYPWNVTPPPTVNAYVRITATDQIFLSGSDVSNAAFLIKVPPVVTCQYPPAGLDRFESSAQVTVDLPGLGLQTTLDLQGPTTVSRSAAVDQGGGINRIDTQITQMDLTGVSCLGPVQVQLNPDIPSVGQVLQTSPTVWYPAESNFDVFVHITVAGQTFHNNQPLAMSSTINSLPPYGDPYLNAVPVTFYDSFNIPVGTVTEEVHTPEPPYDCMLSVAEIDVVLFNEPMETLFLGGPVIVKRDAPLYNPGSGLWEVQTEMLSLDLRGTSANFGPLIVSLNPDTPTTGVIASPGYETYPAQSSFQVSYMIEMLDNPDVVIHTSVPADMVATISGVPPVGDDYEDPDPDPLEDWKTGDPVGQTLREVHTPTDSYPWTPFEGPRTLGYCATVNLTFSPDGGPAITVSGMNARWVIANSAPYTLESGLSVMATRTHVFEASGYSIDLNDSVFVYTIPGGSGEAPPPGQGPNWGTIEQDAVGPVFPATSMQDLYVFIHIKGSNLTLNNTLDSFTLQANLNEIPFNTTHFGSTPVALYDVHGPVGSLQSMSISPLLPYDPGWETSPDCGVTSLGNIGNPFQPVLLRVRPSQPNPFSSAVSIRFDLPEDAEVTVAIFDIQGRQVRKFSGGVLPVGPNSIAWDGRNDRGEDLTSGIYFYRLFTKVGEASGRMVMVR